MSKYIHILSIILLSFQSLYPVTKGSESAVSVEPSYTFTGTDNLMLGFGWFKNGFAFEDASTTCSFNDVFPVSGTVDLNGGTLYLSQDLLFHNVTDLLGMGTIYGYDHLLDLCSSITSIPDDTQTFSDINITFNNDITFNSVITFTGHCVINGNNNKLCLGNSGGILVASGSTLELKNLNLSNVANANVACVDCTSNLILNNIIWSQDSDTTFTQGSMHIVNEVDFRGTGTFIYDVACTAIVEPNSLWKIAEHLCLSIACSGTIEPLSLTDLTSVIEFVDSTWLVRSPGMKIDKGTIKIGNNVVVDIESTSTADGLTFGDGVTPNVLSFELLPGSTIHFPKGHLTYDVVGDNWIVSQSSTSYFVRDAASYFYINQDLVLPYISMTSDVAAVLVIAPGKILYYHDIVFDQPDSVYQMDCRRYNYYTYLLDGNKYFFLRRGNFAAYILVSGTNNKLQGVGTISGEISLTDTSAQLTVDFGGAINHDIQLNGGTLLLNQNCSLGTGAKLIGGGTINLDSNTLICGYDNEVTWTGSYRWEGVQGCVALNTNLKITGTWTFDGNCMIDGKNHSIDLSDGEIILAAGSTLLFKNVKTTGISGTKIRCLDNAGEIVMDDASFYLESGFTYTLGSFRVIDNVEFTGGSCTYLSDQVSSIAPYSSLTMSDIQFQIGQVGTSMPTNPFTFEDSTSQMKLDNCSVVVYNPGLQMTKGTIICDRDVVMEIHSTDTATGIFLGDGTPANDISFELGAGASLEFSQGHVTYNVTSGEGIKGQSVFAKFKRAAGTMFYAKQSNTFRNLVIEDSPLAQVAADPGVMFLYDNVNFICNDEETQSNYTSSCYGYGPTAQLLAGDQSIYLGSRSLPISTYISGTGNIIYGDGGILQPITFLNSAAQLYLGIGGPISGGVVLNGATLTLSAGLNGLRECGPGTIDLSSYNIQFAATPLSWTQDIVWQSDSGSLSLQSKITLSSTWTFSGDCTIYGNGHTFDLTHGSIVLAPNTHVKFKSITLEGISDSTIICQDDSSTLELNDLTWNQDGNYTFSTGSLVIKESVKMRGSYTFEFSTSSTCTIAADATLKLDNGFTFDYMPTETAPDLIVFEDESSILELSGATLRSAYQGLQLTYGTLRIREHSYLSTTSTTTQDGDGNPLTLDEGIIFGDEVADDDFTCEIGSGVTLEVNGVLKNKNVNSYSWIAPTPNSTLYIADNSKLYLYYSLDLGPAIVMFGKDTYLYTKPDISIISSVSVQGNFEHGYIS